MDFNTKKFFFNSFFINKFQILPLLKGSSFVSSGLGVLEQVGKKTFDILSEKDPNLKQTREFFKSVPAQIVSQKPNLSQVISCLSF